jgi:hypothetical protein
METRSEEVTKEDVDHANILCLEHKIQLKPLCSTAANKHQKRRHLEGVIQPMARIFVFGTLQNRVTKH